MSRNVRDRKVLDEAKFFCRTKSHYPQPCNHHKPTLEEIQSTSFSDYVRRVVLRQAEPKYEDEVIVDALHSNGDQPGSQSPTSPICMADSRPPAAKDIIHFAPIPYGQGIAKISLPKGFIESGGVDPTGRGKDWEEGSPLGDMMLPSPIKQVLRGIGGVYEYTFLDLPPMSAAKYREKADAYLRSQVGPKTDISIELLERKFWKRLGPTMEPALYGADMEGTLFNEAKDCSGWNISKLHSCLELLLCDQPDDHEGGIPGVTTPYLYFGMWASVFCAHMEDMNLLSINYLHAGAPKVWYAVPSGDYAQRLEHLCEAHYHHAKSECSEFMRHKRVLLSPAILKKAGIPFTTTVQYPGDAIITFPGSYHFGFNTGFNVAEATNFAVPEWVPFGRMANVCLCRPDSVRFDMNKFERLLLQYEREVKQSKRITWRDWAIRLRKKRSEGEALHANSPKGKKQENDSHNSKPKEFWVEVMQPSGKQQAAKAKSSRKRKQSQHEIWHLAKPGRRKSLQPQTRVLCIVPAVMDGDEEDSDSADEEDNEQCFAGVIVEVQDKHARVHFDGMTRKEDSWIPLDSPKLFLDGGRWGEDVSENLPARHYWREEDSRKRCM